MRNSFKNNLNKKKQCVQLRVLTKAVCEDIFSMIENRDLKLNFI